MEASDGDDSIPASPGPSDSESPALAPSPQRTLRQTVRRGTLPPAALRGLDVLDEREADDLLGPASESEGAARRSPSPLASDQDPYLHSHTERPGEGDDGEASEEIAPGDDADADSEGTESTRSDPGADPAAYASSRDYHEGDPDDRDGVMSEAAAIEIGTNERPPRPGPGADQLVAFTPHALLTGALAQAETGLTAQGATEQDGPEGTLLYRLLPEEDAAGEGEGARPGVPVALFFRPEDSKAYIYSTSAVNIVKHLVEHGQPPSRPPLSIERFKETLNKSPCTFSAPRDLLAWLKGAGVASLHTSHANLWLVDEVSAALLRRFSVGIKARRVRSIFGDLPELVDPAFVLKNGPESLDEYVPAELESGEKVVHRRVWRRQGRVVFASLPSLQQDVEELRRFGLKSTISIASLLTLNRARAAANLPPFRGWSETKWRDRILASLECVTGFLFEYLDSEPRELADLFRDGGRQIFSFAAACRAVKMGSSVVQERLEALSEVAQFAAVRGGRINKLGMETALALRELGKRLGQLQPRAPRFADAALLEDPTGLLHEFRARARALVYEYDAQVGRRPSPAVVRSPEALELAERLRAYLVTYLLTPLAGSQRGQVLARLQLVAEPRGSPCNTCTFEQCPGNRVQVLEAAPGGFVRRVRICLAHHKNELAGRTRAPIDFVTEDAVLAELLDRYRASGRHILLWHAAEAPDPAAVQLQLQEQALARGEEARARALAAQQARARARAEEEDDDDSDPDLDPPHAADGAVPQRGEGPAAAGHEGRDERAGAPGPKPGPGQPRRHHAQPQPQPPQPQPRPQEEPAAAAGRAWDYLFLALPRASGGGKRRAGGPRPFAGDSGLTSSEVLAATSLALGREGYGPRRMRNLGAVLVASLDGLQPEDKKAFYSAMGTSAEQIAGAYDLTGMSRGVLAVTRRLLDDVRERERAARAARPAEEGRGGAGAGPRPPRTDAEILQARAAALAAAQQQQQAGARRR